MILLILHSLQLILLVLSVVPLNTLVLPLRREQSFKGLMIMIRSKQTPILPSCERQQSIMMSIEDVLGEIVQSILSLGRKIGFLSHTVEGTRM